MGRKKKGDAAAPEGEEAAADGGKKKGNLVPAIIIAVGLVLGGKMMGGGGGGAAAAPAAAESTTTTEAPGPVESLDSITLNLADGHYLKVGLSLQLSAEHEAPAAEGEEADVKVTWAKAFDLAIDVFGKKSYGELVSPEGRELAKMELEKHLEEAYPHVVEGVYLTEFVLQ